MDPLTLACTYGLEATLRCQDRLIRRDQALAVGITEPTLAGLLRRGRWERVLPRVFAVGVDVMHPSVRVRAAWLWAGEDSVISGAAAAWWLGLRDEPPGLVEVVVPPARRMTAQPNVKVIRAVVPPDEQHSRNRIVVTATARTCLDLARAGREDRLDTALRKGWRRPAICSGHWLADVDGAARRKPGSPLPKWQTIPGQSQSDSSTSFFGSLESPDGPPTPRRRRPVGSGSRMSASTTSS